MSPTEDTYVVIHAVEPHRDLCLDLGLTGEEKVSEFVVAVVSQYKKLTGNTLPVHFSDSIPYNVGRTPKSKGVDCTLKFEASSEPSKGEGCGFKPGKGNVNTVLYSTITSPMGKKRASMRPIMPVTNH
jgi:hypothetical protein